MTVRVSKPEFNLREKLTELDKPTSLKGSELMRSDTSQDARDLISAGRKNKIINGAMMIDQRNAGSSNTNSNGFHVDRFRTQVAGMDQLVQTYQQVSDGPDGFPKSLKITTTTAETALASTGEYLALYQKIEGQNLQDLAYGTISAKPVTVSFYVKSSITGTFGYTVYRDESTDRAINKTYTIDNANTWERKIITLEGDTHEAIGNGNAANWWNVWHLGSAPGYMSAPTSVWADYTSSNWAGFHKQNGVITTQNATWYITGVQIEVGENATEFEHRSFGEELALCQRYCVVYGANEARHLGCASAYNATNVNLSLHLPVPMRAKPTPTKVTGDGGNVIQVYMGTTGYLSNPTISNASDHGADHNSMRLYVQSAASGLNAGEALWCHTVPNAKLILSAEL